MAGKVVNAPDEVTVLRPVPAAVASFAANAPVDTTERVAVPEMADTPAVRVPEAFVLPAVPPEPDVEAACESREPPEVISRVIEPETVAAWALNAPLDVTSR